MASLEMQRARPALAMLLLALWQSVIAVADAWSAPVLELGSFMSATCEPPAFYTIVAACGHVDSYVVGSELYTYTYTCNGGNVTRTSQSQRANPIDDGTQSPVTTTTMEFASGCIANGQSSSVSTRVYVPDADEVIAFAVADADNCALSTGPGEPFSPENKNWKFYNAVQGPCVQLKQYLFGITANDLLGRFSCENGVASLAKYSDAGCLNEIGSPDLLSGTAELAGCVTTNWERHLLRCRR